MPRKKATPPAQTSQTSVEVTTVGEVINMVDDEAAGEQVMDSRHTQETKQGYSSCMKGMIAYFESSVKHPGCVEDDSSSRFHGRRLKLPLPIQAVKSLFGSLATKRMKSAAKKKKKKTTQKVDDCDEEEEEEDTTVNVEYGANNILRYTDSGENEEDEAMIQDPDYVAVTAEEEQILGDVCTSGLRNLPNINFRTMSRSHLQNHVSSLKEEYSIRKMTFTDRNVPDGEVNVNEWIGKFVKAYNRIIGDKKERGVMKLSEGKRAVSARGVRSLQKKFIGWVPSSRSKLAKNSGIFGWVCSSMQWQNLCRIETLDRFHECHFQWVDDALELELVKTKKDQGATGKGKKRKLYVNAEDPLVCGVLPIAIWAIMKESCEGSSAGEKFLDGKDQKARYRKLLKQVWL